MTMGATSAQYFRKTCPPCNTVQNHFWLFIKERHSVVHLQTAVPDDKATDLLPAVSYQAESTELGKADT